MAAELVSDGRSEVLFVGTPDGLEARLVGEAGFPYRALRARGFDRGSRLSIVPAALTTAVSVLRAWRLVGRWRPDVVLGFGGYVSLPVGLAASLRGVPVVLHEQNSVPGLANRVLSKRAAAVAVTYEGSAARLGKPGIAEVTGNPVRTAVLESSRGSGREKLGLPEAALVLLVFGGSRGARHLNRATVALAEELGSVEGLTVVHIAGREEVDDVRERLAAAGAGPDAYRVHEFMEDMGSAIAAADLVVARAGATSIAEITAVGRPAILVPYPYATDDHQTLNAAAVEEAGGAVVVADETLDGPAYRDALMGLLRDRVGREKMAAAAAALGRPEAAGSVADLARRHASGAGAASGGGS